MKQLPAPISHANSPIAIDLFSGCGGLTLGLKKAGFRVVGAVENHKLAADTYKANHSEVKVWHRDITGLAAIEVRRVLRLKSGQLDLLAGCPPCQAFSTMRTLNGKRVVRDKTKDLLFQFIRFVRVLKPKSIMIENVPGLARDKRMLRLCTKLARLGYASEFRVFDAANFGVAQRRRRMIFLASRAVGTLRFARPRPMAPTVWRAIRVMSVPGNTGDAIHDMKERRSPSVLRRIKRIPDNGGSRTDLPRSFQLRCHKRCDGFKDVYGRMAWGDVAPTITSGCFNPSKGRFLHPSENRAITLREAALLQGFPRTYIFDATQGKISTALMIGNALPPPFIAAHAKVIRKSLYTT